MTDHTFAPQLPPGKNGTRHINDALHALRITPGGDGKLTVATLPAAADCVGVIVAVKDGDAGKPCLAVSDGTAFHRISLGAPVATS